MTDPISLVALSAAGLAAVAMASFAALHGWRGWLELKRLDLGGASGEGPRAPSVSRTEITTLRERVRRLEAIASGEPQPGRP